MFFIKIFFFKQEKDVILIRVIKGVFITLQIYNQENKTEDKYVNKENKNLTNPTKMQSS